MIEDDGVMESDVSLLLFVRFVSSVSKFSRERREGPRGGDGFFLFSCACARPRVTRWIRSVKENNS